MFAPFIAIEHLSTDVTPPLPTFSIDVALKLPEDMLYNLNVYDVVLATETYLASLPAVNVSELDSTGMSLAEIRGYAVQET